MFCFLVSHHQICIDCKKEIREMIDKLVIRSLYRTVHFRLIGSNYNDLANIFGVICTLLKFFVELHGQSIYYVKQENILWLIAHGFPGFQLNFTRKLLMIKDILIDSWYFHRFLRLFCQSSLFLFILKRPKAFVNPIIGSEV